MSRLDSATPWRYSIAELRRIDLGHTAPREPAEERVPAEALRALTPALQNAGLRYIIQRRALGA